MVRCPGCPRRCTSTSSARSAVGVIASRPEHGRRYRSADQCRPARAARSPGRIGRAQRQSYRRPGLPGHRLISGSPTITEGGIVGPGHLEDTLVTVRIEIRTLTHQSPRPRSASWSGSTRPVHAAWPLPRPPGAGTSSGSSNSRLSRASRADSAGCPIMQTLRRPGRYVPRPAAPTARPAGSDPPFRSTPSILRQTSKRFQYMSAWRNSVHHGHAVSARHARLLLRPGRKLPLPLRHRLAGGDRPYWRRWQTPESRRHASPSWSRCIR